MNFSQFVADQIQHNNFLTGAIGGGVVAYALAQARSVPSRLVSLFLDQFTVHLTVHGEDQFAEHLALFLAEHKWVKRSRKLGVYNVYRRNNQELHDWRWNYGLTAGPGMHVIRMGKHFLWINWQEEKATAAGDEGKPRMTTITLRALGRSRKVFEELIETCRQREEGDTRIKVQTWGTNGSYNDVVKRHPRSMDTVFFDAKTKADLIKDAQDFFNGSDWYADHGVPFRRGFMLEGPPGTGKTTLIFALASLLNKPLYIINPNSVATDQSLAEAFAQAGDGIVVIEDLDAAPVTIERDPDLLAAKKVYEDGRRRPGIPGAALEKASASAFGITLSGLLNAIDGLGAAEGRLMIVTSNHPENLDQALVRPGRIDRRFHVGPLENPDLALAMCKHFLGDSHGASYFEAFVRDMLPLTPAVLQNMLLTELHGATDEDHQQAEPAGAAGEGAGAGQLFEGRQPKIGYGAAE